MNGNSGNDPMLSSFINEDWGKFHGSSSVTDSATSSVVASQTLTPSFLISPDGLLNSEFSDLTTLWPTERKRVLSIKMEDDDSFSSYSVAGEVDNRDIDIEDMDMSAEITGTNIKTDIHEIELYDAADISPHNSRQNKCSPSKFQMSEADARKYVEEQFEKIAVVPKSHLNQREKIEFILARSDCTEFTVEDILNFDKKCPDSARACAQIVQNIPQRYRWECVRPEDIPCCYTIVADCKKVSCRDKPPRPMNAFMIWAQSARRLINELCPKMQNALISEALGYYWRQKTDAFKQHFEQEKMKLRRFHSVEFPEYKYKPKTKVQKAREKQEMSLTKAKLRASVKLEKLRRTEEESPRRTKCGRPKKAKVDPLTKEANSPLSSSQYAVSEKCTRKTPTKPAIKDMLTLKILNDRMCKDTHNTLSRSRDLVVSAFGQLSPIEVDSRGSNEVDMSNFDQDLRGKAVSSSVFDTPANTPPVDYDERHHSPMNPQQASPSSVACELPQQIPTDVCPFTSLPPAVATTPTNPGGSSRGTHNISLLELLTKRTSLSTLQPQSTATDQVLDITDLLFTYVTESLSAAQHSTHTPARHYPKCSVETTDDNNNSDINNNNNSDINNNNNYQEDNNNNMIPDLNSSPPKPPNFLYEASDLDMLFLDLNVPILTDDDVRSILNNL